MPTDLSVTIGQLQLKNPLILASGILGDKPSLLQRIIKAGAAAVTTKSITIEKREGYSTPIIIATDCGYINAVGLANPGIDKIPDLVNSVKLVKGKVIVSIAGSTVSEFLKLAEVARNSGADAIELNLSCPHVKKHGLSIGMDSKLVHKIIQVLNENIEIPIFAKFGISDNYLTSCKAAEDAGADAIVLINTIRAMKIDVWIKKPVLSNKFGGLSGPAIHPIAVRAVYEAYEKINIPIIGVGGIYNWESAVELMLAGASAVQIGSGVGIRGIDIFNEILLGIRKYLMENKVQKITEIIGLAHEERKLQDL